MAHRRRFAPVLALLLVVAPRGVPAEVSGTVVDAATRKPVGGATVVLVDNDVATTTGANGSFAFAGLEGDLATILVVAPGYEEHTGLYSVSSGEPIVIGLELQLVDMETIQVVAPAPPAETLTASSYGSDRLRELPTGGNPYAPVDTEPDVVPVGVVDEVSWQSSDLPSAAIFPTDVRSRVSVQGAPVEWNGYLYGYIPLPYGLHAFGLPFPRSTVPAQAVGSLTVYRGTYPVSAGPGVGGLFVIRPLGEAERPFEITVSPSPASVDVLVRSRMGNVASLLVSARKSLFECTYLALMNLDQARSGLYTAGNGDLLARVVLGDEAMRVSLDLLASYDMYGETREDSLVDGVWRQLGEPEGTSTSRQAYLATGLSWEGRRGPRLSGSASVHYTHSGSERQETNRDDEKAEDVASTIAIRADTFGGSAQLHVSPCDGFSIEAGSRITYSVASFVMDTVQFENWIEWWDPDTGTWEEIRSELKSYGADYHDTDRATFLHPYAWVRAHVAGQRAALSAGAGLSWLPTEPSLLPSLEGEGLIRLADTLTFGLRAGWSPAPYSEITAMERRLNERYLGIAAAAGADSPPRGVSSSAFIHWAPDARHTIEVEPYLSWYYGLSGLCEQTVYRLTADPTGGMVFLAPEKGYGGGATISWRREAARYEHEVAYTLAWNRFHVPALGWVSSNTDIRHAVKAGATLRPAAGLTIAANAQIFLDRPFTPYTVVDTDGDGQGDATEAGGFNTGRDLLPRYRLDVQVRWTFPFLGGKAALFLNTANLLFPLNPVLAGLKRELATLVGASTEDWQSRRYELAGRPNNLLQSEIGFSITY